MNKRTKKAKQKREHIRAWIGQLPDEAATQGTYTRPGVSIRDISMGGVSADIEEGPLAQSLLDGTLHGFGINVQLSPQEAPLWVQVRPVWLEPIKGGIVGGFQFVGLTNDARQRVAAYLKDDLQRQVIDACNQSDTDSELQKRLVEILKQRGAIS